MGVAPSEASVATLWAAVCDTGAPGCLRALACDSAAVASDMRAYLAGLDHALAETGRLLAEHRRNQEHRAEHHQGALAAPSALEQTRRLLAAMRLLVSSDHSRALVASSPTSPRPKDDADEELVPVEI